MQFTHSWHLHMYIVLPRLRLDGCELLSWLALRLRLTVLLGCEVDAAGLLVPGVRGSGLD
jgi:hypothetical protein